MSESNYGIPYPGPLPSPTPEHQRRIFKEKAFEIVTVVVLIIGFFGFLAWRNYMNSRPPAVTTLQQTAAVLKDFELDDAGDVRGVSGYDKPLESHGFEGPLESFNARVELFGAGENAPLEQLNLYLSPTAAKWPPSPEALQAAVNRVREIAAAVLPSSAQALETAVTTSELIQDSPRPHDKGVGATSDGWKLSYFTYRSFDETANPPQVVLVLTLERMEGADTPPRSEVNRALYQAVKEGRDIGAAVSAVGSPQ